jgi:hypothetical protein
MVIQRPIHYECRWIFLNWIYGTLNPWILSLVTKWTSGWPNEHKRLSDWPCTAIQWPIQDEYHWNFQIWISETLNPRIISFVTKWSNCDQTTVGHRADPRGLFIGDPYEMNAFGILKIRPPRAEKIIPHPLTPVLAHCDLARSKRLSRWGL